MICFFEDHVVDLTYPCPAFSSPSCTSCFDDVRQNVCILWPNVVDTSSYFFISGCSLQSLPLPKRRGKEAVFFSPIQVTAYQKWVEQQQHCGNVAAERATNVTATFQWPFQDPKLEIPSIYKAYVRPVQGDIPTKYGQTYGTNVPPF